MTETQAPAPAPAASGPAPGRRRTTRRAGVALAAVGAATGAALAGLTALSGPGGLGPTAFAVSHLPGGKVAVRVVSTAATAGQLTRQLHRQGVDVSVRVVPTTPQLVGTWVMASFTGDVPVALSESVAAQTRGYVATLELPATFPGHVTLYVGRAMRPGERPQVAGARNALAPGGLLFCDRLSGAAPEVAARTLTAAGYTVHWADGTRGLYARQLAVPPEGARVSAAFVFDFDPHDVSRPIRAPHDVTVVVIDPRDRRYLPQMSLGFAPSQRVAPGAIDYSSCPTG